MKILEKVLLKLEGQTIISHSKEYRRGWNDCKERFFNIIRSHMEDDGWIPVEKELPKTDTYILLSFSNFSLPMVGRYEADEGGGAFYLGDCDGEDTCIGNDLYVNAWQPLPKPYCPKDEDN